MQLKLEQLAAHLAKGVRPLYALHGDEPLLLQQAADAIRAAARASGCEEREVFHVSGAHFDWSGVLGAAQEMSLFASGKILEIRIPSGKPGKDGGEALQRHAGRPAEGVVTLVLLPRLDGSALKSGWFGALDSAGISLRIDPVGRAGLPAWIAARLARQGQRVADGPEGERALAFFADRVEGNLLAAHQEIQKLALLHPAGVLQAEHIESAVLDVARYDIRQLCAAVLDGQVQRALRMLDGLRAEGETAVGVHWQLANDLRDLARVRRALDEGRPMPLALSEARLFGPRQALVERAVGRFSGAALSRLLSAAAVCDGVAKGLVREDWPQDAWEAVRRLVLMALHFSRAAERGSDKGSARRRLPLALPANLA
jgi:DNA polymerase III subunit delta